MTLRMIDTFSGIGGFSLAARWLGGIETVQFVERDPYCQRILAKHWPTVPIHDDICTFNPAPGSADIVCGGFPCQDISTAGKQAGIKEGTRSGLFYELMRVVRLVGPRYIVLENVAAITSNGMDAVLGTLAEAGFDAEWACIPASAVGACHRRDRWWCVAYAKGEQCHDRGLAHSARPTKAAAEPGDGDGADAGPELLLAMLERRTTKPASHPNRTRSQRQTNARLQGSGVWDSPSRRLDPDWTGYTSQPVIRRGDDGFPGRVDRLKALGNAVVPQVAMIPLSRVLTDYQ